MSATTTVKDINNAFTKFLAAVAGIAPIIYENQAKLPPTGSLWLKTMLIPAETEAAGVGVDAFNLQQGIFQVSVFAPPDTGKSDADDMADKIISAFSRGVVVDSGSVRCRVSAAWSSEAVKEDAWLHIPVSVRWFAYTLN